MLPWLCTSWSKVVGAVHQPWETNARSSWVLMGATKYLEAPKNAPWSWSKSIDFGSSVTSYDPKMQVSILFAFAFLGAIVEIDRCERLVKMKVEVSSTCEIGLNAIGWRMDKASQKR